MFDKVESALFGMFSPLLQTRFNPGNNIASLYFHHVVDKSCPYAPDDLTYAQLRTLVRVLKRHFDFVGADRCLPGQAQPDKPTLMLTFDDGYLNNVNAACRLKEEEGVVASFFISTAGTLNGYLWQDVLCHGMKTSPQQTVAQVQRTRERYHLDLPPMTTPSSAPACYQQLAGYIKYWPAHAIDDLENALLHHCGAPSRCMMTAQDIATLASMGHTIGAHTHHHRILSTLDETTARQEIETSRTYLEQITQRPVHAFAYPNGAPGRDYDERDVQLLIAAGFKVAYSTQDTGFTTQNAFHRGRFLPYRSSPLLRAMSTIKIAGDPS